MSSLKPDRPSSTDGPARASNLTGRNREKRNTGLEQRHYGTALCLLRRLLAGRPDGGAHAQRMYSDSSWQPADSQRPATSKASLPPSRPASLPAGRRFKQCFNLFPLCAQWRTLPVLMNRVQDRSEQISSWLYAVANEQNWNKS